MTTETTHRRKPTEVQAYQYRRQPRTEWPQWLQDYQIATLNMGMQPVGAGPGVMLVPSKSGVTTNVTDGEWVVLDTGLAGGQLTVFKNDAFQAQFEAIGADEPAPAVPEAAPAVEQVSADPAPAAPKGRAKTAAAPVAEKTEAETAAPEGASDTEA